MLAVVDLGTMSYGTALELQRAVANARTAGTIPDTLLVVEHPPVVTLGRGTKAGHLVASESLLGSRGVELFEVDRGGDVTYHGPGQLVGYPILDLKAHRQDLHWYLRQLEEALIRALAACGLPAARRDGFTGVWTSGRPVDGAIPGGGRDTSALRKIASIGVHARDWVTWHGFALNVTTDLTNFELIIPCGISGVTMTSVDRELGAFFPGSVEVRDALVTAFGATFGLAFDYRDVAWLDGVLSAQSTARAAT